MQLGLKGFSQLVEDMAAALQGAATALVDVSVGSVMRAIFEANASVALWIQWLIILVLQTTRASTAAGSDLDSWMNDFGVVRLPATPSTGLVVFSRLSPALAASVPPGSVVKTSDGLLSFTVTEDTSISIWQPALACYVLPSGVAAANLPVTCVVPGSSGNVVAGSITVIASSLPGIDAVSNANPLGGGLDAESDPALRVRFQSYLASRARATMSAVRYAIASVQQNLDFIVKEHTAPDGSFRAGSFMVVLDDGSGYPSNALLSTVASAIETVRPIATTYCVIPPLVVPVDVTLTVIAGRLCNVGEVIANVQNSVADYLNSLAIERSASVTRLAQSIYQSVNGIDNITNVNFNGQQFDVTPGAASVIKSGSITVDVNAG